MSERDLLTALFGTEGDMSLLLAVEKARRCSDAVVQMEANVTACLKGPTTRGEIEEAGEWAIKLIEAAIALRDALADGLATPPPVAREPEKPHTMPKGGKK